MRILKNLRLKLLKLFIIRKLHYVIDYDLSIFVLLNNKSYLGKIVSTSEDHFIVKIEFNKMIIKCYLRDYMRSWCFNNNSRRKWW